jgi:hypothetical protein
MFDTREGPQRADAQACRCRLGQSSGRHGHGVTVALSQDAALLYAREEDEVYLNASEDEG